MGENQGRNCQDRVNGKSCLQVQTEGVKPLSFGQFRFRESGTIESSRYKVFNLNIRHCQEYNGRDATNGKNSVSMGAF